MSLVVITLDAERDLQEIFDFIAAQDSVVPAEAVLRELERAIESLARHAARGAVVPELAALGMRQYRQLIVKPYRVIYQLHESHVFVVLIAHAARDMQSLLQLRLLR